MLHNIMRYSYLSILGMLAISADVQAGSIRNFTDNVQVILLEQGRHVVPIEIAPNQSFSRISPFYAQYAKRRLYVCYNMEYAIWHDGSIGPQRVQRKDNIGH